MADSTLFRLVVLTTVIGGVMNTTGCSTRPVVIAAPPQLAVDPSHPRRPAPIAAPAYTTLWHAVTAGDLSAAQQIATTEHERQLIRAIQSVFEGAFERAETLAIPLLDAPDSTVRDAARLTYGAALSIQSKWNRLAQFTDTLRARHQHISADEAGIGAWAQAFRTLQPTYTFSDSTVTLPLFRASSGTPIVEVYINGTLKRFWLDTGASLSILSSTAAADCQITPLTPDTLQLMTSIGRLSANPAVIPSLRIGGLTVTDAPAMIVDANALTLKFQLPAPNRAPMRGGPNAGFGPVQELRIDGIIGFDIIRLLDLTIDDPRGKVIIKRPVQKPIRPAVRNLFWFGLPIVKLTAATGRPLQFSLDTGSDETYGTRTLATKTNARSVIGERRTIQGYGTSTTESGVIIPSVRLFLDTTPFLLQRVFLYNARYPTIFDLDGTLGADISRGNVIRIDMTNGRFEVQAG